MNKTSSLVSIFRILLFVTILLSVSCKKTIDTVIVIPEVTTNPAQRIGQGWVTLKGTINAHNEECVLKFEYDTVNTEFKNSLSGIPETVNTEESKIITAFLTGLKPATQYYYRLKAEYPSGTIEGSVSSFTTTNPKKTIVTFNDNLTYGNLTDIDNNNYKTISIGTQTWMAENLKTTKYNDGKPISYFPEESPWATDSTGAYSWYNNDSVTYGALYNFHAVNSSKLCPSGWHVPTDAEWTTLTTYAGSETTTAIKLKEAGTIHWLSNQGDLINETGFTALPGGYRTAAGYYNAIRRNGYWWTSTAKTSLEAYCRTMTYSFNYTEKTNSVKNNGFSVRCVKD